MFVYCNKCNWTQDDFWSEDGYNPFDFLKENYKKELFGGELEKVFSVDKRDSFGNFIGQTPITMREQIANHMNEFANRIKNQRWITLEQFKKENPERLCPICKNKLSED